MLSRNARFGQKILSTKWDLTKHIVIHIPIQLLTLSDNCCKYMRYQTAVLSRGVVTASLVYWSDDSGKVEE